MTIRQNFYVRQGASFSYTYEHDADLSGYTATMRVAGDNTYTPVINGTDVTFALTPAQTEALGDSGSYGAYADAMWSECGSISGMSQARAYSGDSTELKYVVDVAQGGAVERLLEGVITIIKDVD